MSEMSFKLKLPGLPNFLILEIPTTIKKQDGFKELPTIDVADIADDQLRKIADEWKEALLIHAKKRRALK